MTELSVSGESAPVPTDVPEEKKKKRDNLPTWEIRGLFYGPDGPEGERGKEPPLEGDVRERITKYNYVDGTKTVADRLGDGSKRVVSYGKDQMTVSKITPRGGRESVTTPRRPESTAAT